VISILYLTSSQLISVKISKSNVGVALVYHQSFKLLTTGDNNVAGISSVFQSLNQSPQT